MPRLLRSLNSTERPVQFIFSGKAHPKDNPGKEFIAAVAQFARRNELRKKVVFVEDYDMNVARQMVQGVDVWLNNPRRPLEASGTSGMKAAANGIPNLSILDGWWDEGFEGNNGWAIGAREQHPDDEEQDRRDALSLYEALEGSVVPLYYDRDTRGLPGPWIERMRAAMSSSIWKFSTHRMLEEYVERMYLPAARG